MRRFPKLTLMVAALGLTFGLSGCGKGGSSSSQSTTPTSTPAATAAPAKPVHVYPKGTHIKLAFVSNNVANYWNFAHAGVRAFEKKTGIQVTFREPAKGTVAEQNQIIEDLVTEGYNGIAISVIAPNDQIRTLDSAARSLNLICVDSDAPKSNRLMYIGTMNYNAGLLMGKEIVKLLPRGGQVAIFVGNLAARNAYRRLDGIEHVIKGHNITIVAKKEDNQDYARARSNAENVISAFPHLSLMCGLYSYNGALAASAVMAAGDKGKIKVIAFDQDPDTLQDITTGLINATVVQNPFMEGYLSCKYLRNICADGMKAVPTPANVDTGVQIVDAKNLAAYQKKLAKMMASK